jgi:hypothetical protein
VAYQRRRQRISSCDAQVPFLFELASSEYVRLQKSRAQCRFGQCFCRLGGSHYERLACKIPVSTYDRSCDGAAFHRPIQRQGTVPLKSTLSAYRPCSAFVRYRPLFSTGPSVRWRTRIVSSPLGSGPARLGRTYRGAVGWLSFPGAVQKCHRDVPRVAEKGLCPCPPGSSTIATYSSAGVG